MPKPCQCNRWGSGTTCTIPETKTPVGKEVDTKLQQMLAERAKQDTMWTAPLPTPSDPKYKSEKALQTVLNGPSQS